MRSSWRNFFVRRRSKSKVEKSEDHASYLYIKMPSPHCSHQHNSSSSSSSSDFLVPFHSTTAMAFDESNDHLVKASLFILVQAMVYLILAISSNVFSKTKMRSSSFQSIPSPSLRRMVAFLADLPAGGEPSPRPSNLKRKDRINPQAGL